MKLKNLLITATVCALLLSGCSAGSGKTAIRVGDSSITDNDIKFTIDNLMGSKDMDGAVEALKQTYLLKEIADEMNIEFDDEEEKTLKRQIGTFKADQGGKTEGDKLLKKYGVDEDLLEAIIASSMYAEKIFAQLNLNSEPSDDELKQYFKDDYLRAKHVLISTVDTATGKDLDEAAQAEAEKKANEVLEKAKNGEDFNALIEEYNEDPGMASNEEGYFFTDNQMVSEFEEATKSIQPGEFTLCKSSYGYHIIQRLPIDGADFDRFFEENKSSAQSTYASAREQKALEDKAAELGITTEVNQDVIDSIKIDDDSSDSSDAE